MSMCTTRPAPNIHVAHFAVAHLPFRQSNRRPGSLDQRVGKFLHQRVIVRFPRQRDRVSLRLRSESPSVQHCQYNRFRPFCHNFSLRSVIYGSASLIHFNFISHLEARTPRSWSEANSSACNKFSQRREQAFHFVHGVVVHQADTQHPAQRFHAQPLRQIQRVIISIPGENPALA